MIFTIVLHLNPQGGDLRSVISKHREERSLVREEMVWKVLHQLLFALQECHKKRDGVHKVCDTFLCDYCVNNCISYTLTYCSPPGTAQRPQTSQCVPGWSGKCQAGRFRTGQNSPPQLQPCTDLHWNSLLHVSCEINRFFSRPV